MLRRNNSVLCLSTDQSGGDFLKLCVKGLVIQEDPVIVKLAVETILDMSDGLGDVPDIRVPRQSDECSICTISGEGCWGEFLCRIRCCVLGRLGWFLLASTGRRLASSSSYLLLCDFCWVGERYPANIGARVDFEENSN